jgi:hypothetical protein
MGHMYGWGDRHELLLGGHLQPAFGMLLAANPAWVDIGVLVHSDRDNGSRFMLGGKIR